MSETLEDRLVDVSWRFHEVTPLFDPLDLRSVSKFEQSLTEGVKRKLRQTQGGSDEDISVEARWIELSSSSYISVAAAETQPSRISQHLLISLFIDDRLSSKLLLWEPVLEKDRLSSISVALVSGSGSSFRSLWECIESRTGCIFARRAFLPTSYEMSCLAIFLGQLESQYAKENQKEDSNPLKLTFSTPPAVSAAGVDSISISVPSQSTISLLNWVESESSSTSSSRPPKRQRKDIVEVLKEFILEKFRMNVDACSLTKASSTLVSIDHGKFTVRNSRHFSLLIEQVQGIMTQRQKRSFTMTGSIPTDFDQLESDGEGSGSDNSSNTTGSSSSNTSEQDEKSA